MSRPVTGFTVALCFVLLSAGPAFAQTSSDEELSNPVTAPVAHVYVQTTPGVMAYAAAANGKLTPIIGSPFKVSGQMEDISGKHLISVGDTILHTYPIISNGGVGKQVSQTNTAYYGGSECGGTSGQGSVLDHSGQYLYVQLNTYDSCAAWQTYQVESNGYLQFRSDIEYYASDEGGDAISSNVPTINNTDKFAYGVFPEDPYSGDNYCEYYYAYCPYFSAFTRNSSGVLEENYSFSESDPTPPGGWVFYPYAYSPVQADPFGHIAVLMNYLDGYGDSGGLQLASYSINPSSGAISSSNAYYNMPSVSVPANGYITMNISPSGKLLAVAGHSGLQIFHFNGAAPPSSFSGLLLSGIDFDQVKWDSNNHLYALSYDSAQLHVFTITPTSITEAAGSPYYLPYYPYGTRAMVVTK